MPITPTYPGVYIQEAPSGTFTITGVATSITAFLGRAAMGPVNEPTIIFSLADYLHLYGEIGHEFPMSGAVRDFFANGGSQAIIGRIANSAAKTAKAVIGSLTFAASSPGSWPNTGAGGKSGDAPPPGLSVRLEPASAPSVGSAALYTLSVYFKSAARQLQTEIYPAVTLTDDVPNRIDRVLAEQSNFVAMSDYVVPDGIVPASGYITFSGGGDGGPVKDCLIGDQASRTGLYQLEHVDLFNILCIPPDDMDAPHGGLPDGLWATAAAYCASRRAMLIVEPPAQWADAARQGNFAAIQTADLGMTGENARNAAVYFPRIHMPDPAAKGGETLTSACGMIAGVWAATDANRGVWKAPAGVDAGLRSVGRLEFDLTDEQNGLLNPLGINCLRDLPNYGPVAWGARTLRGADALADDYKYIPVRRLTLYIEESLYRGVKFAVFEPNDETLWSQLRLAVDSFMADLARQGAFYNYAVTCDATTTTQYDIDRGVVNIRVAFAPEKPGEFIVLEIQQQAGVVGT